MSKNNRQTHILVIAFALAACTSPNNLLGQIGFPDRPPPRHLAGTTAQGEPIFEVLKKFHCTCSEKPLGWKCQQLSGFGLNEWSHRNMGEFANRILILSKTLPEGRFVIGLQGIADSRTISHPRSWLEVTLQRCRQTVAGAIDNVALAQLRACTVAETLRGLDPEASVRFLQPVAYTPEEKKYAESDRATVVYLLGDNGGCH